MRVEASTEIPEITPAPPKSFEKQFKNPQFVEVNGARVKIVDLIPENPISQIPIVFAPGWSETTTTYKDSLEHIYKEGYRVISFDHPRHGSIAEKIPGVPEVEAKKVQNLQAVLKHKNITRADFIAHSEGALHVAVAATEDPTIARNIALVSPVGLTGIDNVLREIARFGKLSAVEGSQAPRDIFRNLKARVFHQPIPRPNPDTPKLHDIEVAKYVAANPVRALREANAIVKTDIYQTLENLRKKGIGITIIHGVDDPLVPMKTTFKVAEEKGEVDPIDGKRKMPVDGYYSVTHGHNTLSRDERYVNAALDALKGLAKKSDGKQAQTPD